jgi:hypothetical protein
VKKRRPSVLAIAIGLIIASLLGVLGILHAMAPDDEAIRAEIGRAIQEIETMPDADPIAKDRRIEEALAVEDYKKYARSLWTKLDRMHGPVHHAKDAELAARRVVPAFLSRCSNLDDKSLGELRDLEGETQALQNEHRATRFGPALADARARIAAKIAAMMPACTDLDHFRIQQEIERERLAKHFRATLNRIDEVVAKHPRCPDFIAKLRAAREEVLKSAAQSLPNYKGPPDEERIRKQLEELKRP